MAIFHKKQLDLDLNGPTLSFTTNPTGVGSTGVGVGSEGGGSVSLTGIATYSFEGNSGADSDGSISYQWYEGTTAVENGTYITGAATTTLTLTNLITPTDNGREFYLQADFVPGYTGPSTTYLTGNALNEPLNSGVGTVSVDPLLEIIAQPASVTALLDTDATISINADLTDSAYIGAGLTYQWTLNGNVVTDGTVTTTTTTSSTQSGTVEETFTSDGNHAFPSGTLSGIEITVAGAAGGNGGRDSGGPGGRGAQGRAGRFSLPGDFKGANLTMRVGKRGNGGGSGNFPAYGAGGIVAGNGDGGRGGGAGQNGWSGGGGGGGAASYVQLSSAPLGEPGANKIIVSAGGGGGGGGSWNRAGDSGYNRNPGVGLGYGHGNSPGPVNNDDGDNGQDKSGDGGGGGGGGGGVSGGAGGSAGNDNSSGGEAGSGGTSGANTTYATLIGNGWLNDSDGYINLKYTGTTTNEVSTTRNTIVSGTTSKTLTIQSDTVGVQTAQCTVYHPDATNNPILSDEVTFVAVSAAAENNITVESIGVTDTATITSLNLNNGEYTFEIEGTDVDNNGINQFYSFYSPDKDMEVELDLYGGKGDDDNSNAGGEGGYSRIRFTMDRNTEYVIAGLLSSINAPFLYRKATLIACVGQGGDASTGSNANGGFGGGVDVGGENGQGSGNGAGGHVILSGNLSGNGSFGSNYSAPTVYPGDSQNTAENPGQTISCTKGVYWAQQGLTPCQDELTGSTPFRLSDGTIVTNTASITRGFKAGYNIMQTAGAGSADGGDGGNGATGGQGGQGNNGGGGGGSGYQDGSVTVVDTQLGGSTGNAKVVLRVVT